MIASNMPTILRLEGVVSVPATEADGDGEEVELVVEAVVDNGEQ
jgi:hypothetical protein